MKHLLTNERIEDTYLQKYIKQTLNFEERRCDKFQDKIPIIEAEKLDQ